MDARCNWRRISARSLLAALLVIPSFGLAAEALADGEQTAGTLGGPAGVTGEQRDIEDLLDTFRRDNRKVYLKSWYDWKAALQERSGFSFGLNAQMVYAGVSDALGADDDAASGL